MIRLRVSRPTLSVPSQWSALGGFKTALQLLGVIDTNVMARPMTRLDDDEAARIRALLAAADLLD
jgi:4-hydroxy-tetrahydrodipicolinate synthase